MFILTKCVVRVSLVTWLIIQGLVPVVWVVKMRVSLSLRWGKKTVYFSELNCFTEVVINVSL